MPDSSGHGGKPSHDTASGLHEEQIAAEDLARLRDAVVLRAVNPAIAPASPNRMAPGITPRSGLRLAVAPLPGKPRVRRLRPEAGKAVIRRDLRRALTQPIQRRNLLIGELNAAQEKQLYRQLYEQYGEEARQLQVAAVYAHVPSEATHSARVTEDLRSLYFILPPDVSPRGIKGGQFLVVLRDPDGKTSTALLRLN
jgi:hypothetical protein